MTDEAAKGALVGVVFDGRYRVLERVGGGGMGNVYLAEEERLGRRCALKVLHPHLAKERGHVERFLREAQVMARLSHPNIVRIFAFGEDPAGVYFAMELLEGEDLHSRVKARDERPYTISECAAWAIEIARAMSVVHGAGLIHRDLKTANIFLARQGGTEVVKLLDFGIARPVEGSSLTDTGVSLGTPTYMSPEQILSSPLDHRTDIYSLGVLLFRLLTGRLPFVGPALDISVQHCTVPPPRPSEVAPDAGISPMFDAIVLKAMAKQPGERFASMQELEQALRAAQLDSQHTVVARRPAAERERPAAPLAASQLSVDATAIVGPERGAPVGPPRRTRAPARWLLAGVGVVALGLLVASLLPSSPPTVPTREGTPAALRPLDMAGLAEQATACRKTHGAAEDAKVAVEIVVGLDGEVTRALPVARGALGDCVAGHVRSARFPPQPATRFTVLEL